VRRESWLVTCAVTLLMIIALYWIVARGSRTIERQRTASATRVTELSTLLQQNEELRGRVQRSARQAAEHIERYLNRLGSDLHDGAAQMIAFALLRLDATTPAPPSPDPAGPKEDATTVREALLDALNDVRDVCNGLIIPEVRDLSPTGAFLHMARAHQRRTGTSVLCTIGDLPAEVPQFTQLCLCRFIQEALNNAFRHAEGRGQRLNAWFELEKIYVEVSDDGPGMPTVLAQTGAGLGLRGLTDRLACLGGALMVSSTPGRGTSLTAVLPVPRGGT
jgi:signal transduction histidine kinase